MQEVGHHQRHPGTFFEFQFILQVSGKITAFLVQLLIGDLLAHIDKGTLVTVLLTGIFKDVEQRGIVGWINLGGYIGRVAFQPNFFHEESPSGFHPGLYLLFLFSTTRNRAN